MASPGMHDYLSLCLCCSPAPVGVGQGKVAIKMIHLQP